MIFMVEYFMMYVSFRCYTGGLFCLFVIRSERRGALSGGKFSCFELGDVEGDWIGWGVLGLESFCFCEVLWVFEIWV